MTHIEKATPADLGRLAIVKPRTIVKMLEYDLARCKKWGVFGNRWKDLLRLWLDKGAQVELYIQRISKDARNMVQNLKGQDSSLRVYDISDIPEDVLCMERRGLKDSHFTVFHNPEQLWTEQLHRPGDNEMYGCDYYKEEEGFTRTRQRRPVWYREFKLNDAMLTRIKEHKKGSKRKGVGVKQ